MYGLVNMAIRDLVISKSDLETWNAICVEAGLSCNEFVAMDTYPDPVTYALVNVISKRLSSPVPDILRAFGRYWILYTAKQGYGEILAMFGSDFETCLRNLNNMHGRMGSMMPQLVPPRFIVTSEDGDDLICIEYYSKRPGLGHMVLGLLEGLAERFSLIVEVTYIPKALPNLPDIFEVRKIG